MIEETLEDARRRMAATVDLLKGDLAGIRSNRASTGLVENIRVDYFGSEMPLNQLAQISVGDARLIVIQPWDKNAVNSVVKAIQTSDLGMMPNVDGDVIRLNIPALTEERRREMIKVVRAEVETSRVAVRNIRRDANSDLKELLKEKEISEDDERRGQEMIQKLTDKYIKEIDTLLDEKSKALTEF